ncbi:TonB-dependent receptor [Echinicola jeungdonensis]|uniref:Carboxypeptidase-like regulatory domain-containing protein n=1 Tax=Echinicola jeungdonensis TaxID=709343 RepID=A0ABV5J5R4_9BACT|nr:TonB-dependent receptor [Echinicola jeungdonensis]MDN3670988.1 TonB-dependent receptor [Echinicola jeungdonensis]
MKGPLFLIVFYLGFFGPSFHSLAQEPIKVKGIIQDESTGDLLPGASVYWQENSENGLVSDNKGSFTIKADSLPQNLVVSFMGYKSKVVKIDLWDIHSLLKVQMKMESHNLGEITVNEQHPKQHVQSVELGKNSIPIGTIQTIPVIFGEADIFRSLQLLPGIQSVGEASSGLYVRGGSPDQNLVQLDGAPVYNPSHFFGFFSVFNPNGVSDVNLYKGNIPAYYGGRLSSVIDVDLKEGNSDKIKGQGGIGTISSRLSLDGPLFSENSTFAFSARRTYADMILKFSKNEEVNSNQLYFYDLSGKLMFRPSEKDKITISGFHGSDQLGIKGTFGFGWDNWVQSISWKRSWNEKVLMDVNAYYSQYDYLLNIQDESNDFIWKNQLGEGGFKWELMVNPSSKAEFRMGMHSRLYNFAPINVTPGESSNIEAVKTKGGRAAQQDVFISGELDVSKRLMLEAGLRLSFFVPFGPGKQYVYENDQPHPENEVVDTLYYKEFQVMDFYQGKEPRVALRFLLSEELSLKTAFNRHFQYLQVASSNSAGLPIDRWVLAGKYIQPIRSDQYSLGIFKNFNDDQWELSLEGYKKVFKNIIDVRPGAGALFTDQIETQILAGNGWAYGAELFLKKNKGNTTGWLSYTYSRTFRSIPGINNDEAYPPRYDRPHDLSLVLQHKFSERVSASMNFVYTSGQAVTYPEGSYKLENRFIPYYGEERNQDRFPDYHRLDLSLTLKNKDKGQNWKGSWNFGVYNLYGRKNPFSYQFSNVDPSGGSNKPKVIKTYLFTILPSISYKFEF